MAQKDYTPQACNAGSWIGSQAGGLVAEVKSLFAGMADGYKSAKPKAEDPKPKEK